MFIIRSWRFLRVPSALISLAFLAMIALQMTACMVANSGEGQAVASTHQPTGRLSLAITDAPLAAAAQVVVEFAGVAVQGVGGVWHDFDFSAPRHVDLVNLAGGGSELLLDDVILPAGRYRAIRLWVNAEGGAGDSFIVREQGGARRGLRIPEGARDGLELRYEFTVAANGISAFTVDFDLRKSVFATAADDGDYLLRPSLRLVDNLTVGRITGRVAGELLNGDHCNTGAVYLYSGRGAIPDDLGGSGQQPLVAAPVLRDAASGDGFAYTLSYVAAGDYTLAFTCQALVDVANSDEPLHFSVPNEVSLVAGAVAKVDFSSL